MAQKRPRSDIEDDFVMICQDAMTDINMNGKITLDTKNRDVFDFDFDSPDMRWQVCYALKFLKTYGWFPKNKKKVSRSSYGWKHVVERRAKKTGDGFYVCNGAMIIACRLAKIAERSFFNDPNIQFMFDVTFEIEIPQTICKDMECNWKSKAAKKYASIALTCNLDTYLCDALIEIIAHYLDLVFSSPPTFRFHATQVYNQLQPLAPTRQRP